ncbi:type II toxin-antitoxin system VapB family antitoxin [Merismopedia glauca]|uniref:DUF2191 domain-containing protein n=1 Tax=Merismopedia glauca CCAP 1448/3 TaxID=1296344 RepID=A0A2T1C958_9CYAN|nr:type II toxin-antitoxin system VapB family antitoxin [Merismopedia glauca]PSB04673.1 DUF2191 domain-containing protein [Merismopedia glauca CCAP 1448/3]
MNLQIDELLIEEALAFGENITKQYVVEQALREYIKRRQQMRIIDLFGTKLLRI